MPSRIRTVERVKMFDGPVKMSEDKGHLPHFDMDLKNLPEAKSWKIGETYFVAIAIEQKHMSQSDDGPGRAGFDVKKIKVLDKMPK